MGLQPDIAAACFSVRANGERYDKLLRMEVF